MEDTNICPKPDCGRPESTHRYSAGKRLSICGNGHSWDQEAISAQRAKAREAEAQESLEVFDSALSAEAVKTRFYEFERRYRGIIDP
jgi:hypothetical protein